MRRIKEAIALYRIYRISKGQSACRLSLLTDGLAVRPMNARQLTRDIDTWKLANKPALCQSALWRF